MLSIIIPTYNESQNIVPLIARIAEALGSTGEVFEILVMDDDSPDGTAGLVNSLQNPEIRAINRRGRSKGLSAAVIDGFAHARGNYIAVMDADLSHPPSVLPLLLDAVRQGVVIAVASRYVPGGGIRDWPLRRIITSRVACLLARPLTPVRDATSGFFLLKRESIDGVRLDGLGFKIGLEVFVKARHEGKIREVPYVFTDRRAGDSKLRPAVMGSYLRQLWNLFRRKTLSEKI